MVLKKFLTQAIPGLLLLVTISTHISCKKKNDLPPDNDEVKATMTFSSGIVLNTHTTGMNARMGCDIYGITSFIESNDEINGRITITHFGNCVSATGTIDKVDIQYLRYPNSQSSPVYNNSIVRTPGSSLEYSGKVTFTTVTSDYLEGNFNAVCWSYQGKDSVIISGTFKGKKQ